ncbi:MAG TPA: radical SAM protein [bacterium]|nr:radical SAM protein [bacterium]HOL46608.1 radical SAM protein [bacterium]HPQ17821.1 radical SAM protein [bacterium]
MIVPDPITKKSDINLGYVCDINCQFCYYKFGTKPFMQLQEVKELIDKMKNTFDLKSIDWQGGEPTIYKHLLEALEYAKNKGFHNTIITHGLNLTKDKLKDLKSAGLDEILISVHGFDFIHNIQTGVSNGWQRINNALCNINEIGIPLRTNTVINKYNYGTLPHLAKFFLNFNINTHNFINFNYFATWAKDKDEFADPHFQIQYKFVRPFLEEAIEILKSGNRKINLRYIPFCVVDKKYAEHIVGFKQVFFDPDEWLPKHIYNENYFSMDEINKITYTARLGVKFACAFSSNEFKECKKCSYQFICDGLSKRYYLRFGDEDLKAINDDNYINDFIYFRKKDFPKYFIADYNKNSDVKNINYLDNLNQIILFSLVDNIYLYLTNNIERFNMYINELSDYYVNSHYSIFAKAFQYLINGKIQDARYNFRYFDIVDNHKSKLGDLGIILTLMKEDKSDLLQNKIAKFKNINFNNEYRILEKIKEWL